MLCHFISKMKCLSRLSGWNDCRLQITGIVWQSFILPWEVLSYAKIMKSFMSVLNIGEKEQKALL